MELRDLIVTPILIILVYAGAYFLRPHLTDSINRRYFFPALTVRIFGALALGFIYQFYYRGGDTFNYHTHGGRVIWDALIESPETGIKLLFSDGSSTKDVFRYASKIYFYRDHSSYFLIRMIALIDITTFSSYSGTAVIFAVISFIGAWMLFLTFYKEFPTIHLGIALATMFVPSVFFWGSGILKDTVVVSCLGIATYLFYRIFIERRGSISGTMGLFFVLYVIFNIKLFILQVFLPSVIVWIVAYNFTRVRSIVLKSLLVPIMALIVIGSSIFSIIKIGEGDAKYSVANLAKTAKVTAYDIRFWTGRDAGSGYTLDVEEWTPVGMLGAAPAAINVALFRPYLWEAKNPLMLISAIESLALLLFTIYVLIRRFRFVIRASVDFNFLFCSVFSLSFAFAVGISTFNFGTLTRYRIPLIPFYLLSLIILLNYSNKDRKLDELEITE